MCCDYILAFGALGLAGIFWKSKNGLVKGYLLGILARGAFHTLGGYLYWMDYMPENFPQSLAALYPIIYNYSYILAEAVLTVIVISLPPFPRLFLWSGKQLRRFNRSCYFSLQGYNRSIKGHQKQLMPERGCLN